MRAFRATLVATRRLVDILRWLFEPSRIFWLTKVVTTSVVATTLVFFASLVTVALNLPEETPSEWITVSGPPLDLFARMPSAIRDDSDRFWRECLKDPVCLQRVSATDGDPPAATGVALIASFR